MVPPPGGKENSMSGFSTDWKKHVDEEIAGVRRNQHDLANSVNVMGLNQQKDMSDMKLAISDRFNEVNSSLADVRRGTSLTTLFIQSLPSIGAAIFAYLTWVKK